MGHLYRVNNIISDIIDNRWFLALCLVSYIPVQYFYMKTGIAIFHGGAALCAIIVINHFFKVNEFGVIGNYFNYFGIKSLDIYLYHGFVLSLFNLEFFNLWVSGTLNIMIEIIVSIIIAVVVAITCILIGNIIKSSPVTYRIIYGKI